MKSNIRDQQDVAGDSRPSERRKEEASRPDTGTYVDDGGTRFYRHPPVPVRAFEVVLNVGDGASNLTVGTPEGTHEIDVEIRAHLQGAMQPVLRLRGQATRDGGLELIVTNLQLGEGHVIELESMTEAPQMFDPEEMAKQVEKLKAEGRMPSLETVLQVMELVRDEWRDAVGSQPGARKTKPN